VENPEIAVAVVVEHGVWGSNVAPIARDVLAAYFGIELQQETETEED
jgi:penicillin-binding protein 2